MRFWTVSCPPIDLRGWAATRRGLSRYRSRRRAKPTILTRGNPQIPKGVGDAPVRAHIDALDGWNRQTSALTSFGKVAD